MQNLRLHLRPAESKPAFNQSPRDSSARGSQRITLTKQPTGNAGNPPFSSWGGGSIFLSGVRAKIPGSTVSPINLHLSKQITSYKNTLQVFVFRPKEGHLSNCCPLGAKILADLVIYHWCVCCRAQGDKLWKRAIGWQHSLLHQALGLGIVCDLPSKERNVMIVLLKDAYSLKPASLPGLGEASALFLNRRVWGFGWSKK